MFQEKFLVFPHTVFITQINMESKLDDLFIVYRGSGEQLMDVLTFLSDLNYGRCSAEKLRNVLQSLFGLERIS